MPIFKRKTIGCINCLKVVENPRFETNNLPVSLLDEYIQRRLGADTAVTASQFWLVDYSESDAYYAPLQIRRKKTKFETCDDRRFVREITLFFTDAGGLEHDITYTARVCPYCKSKILSDAGMIDFYLIAVVGNPAVGKTLFRDGVYRLLHYYQSELKDHKIRIKPFHNTRGRSTAEILNHFGPVPKTAVGEDHYRNCHWFNMHAGHKEVKVIINDMAGESFANPGDYGIMRDNLERCAQADALFLFEDLIYSMGFQASLNFWLQTRQTNPHAQAILDFLVKEQLLPDHIIKKIISDTPIDYRTGYDSLDRVIEDMSNDLTFKETFARIPVMILMTKLDIIEKLFDAGWYRQKSLVEVNPDRRDSMGGEYLLLSKSLRRAANPGQAPAKAAADTNLDVFVSNPDMNLDKDRSRRMILESRHFIRNEDPSLYENISRLRNNEEIDCFLISNGMNEYNPTAEAPTGRYSFTTRQSRWQLEAFLWMLYRMGLLK